MRRVVARCVIPAVLLGVFGVSSGVVGGGCARAARAAGTHRAGVVVEFGNGDAREFCVSFADDSISGLEALRRTGLPLVYQDYGGSAVTVCKIDDEGCDYPRVPCFCECARAGARDCTFWGYYRLSRATGAWEFAESGPGSTIVRDGDLNGWRWGRHQGGASPPASTSLARVCARAGSGMKSATVTPTLMVTARATRARGSTPAGLVAFGAVVVGLAVWAARVARRRRAKDEPR